MQFFAILAKQEEGSEEHKRTYVLTFLTTQLSRDKIQEYIEFYDTKAKSKKKKGSATKLKMTSVGDSVRIFGICKKINKTLTQHQKIIVLLRLFEFMKYDNNFLESRMQIVETAANVFNIDDKEIVKQGVVLKRGHKYKIYSANANEADGKVIFDLYTKSGILAAKSFFKGNHYKSITFTCAATEMYYLKCYYDSGKFGCGVVVLAAE